MTYSDGYQDGYLGRPQQQVRRPYATGYRHGRFAYELATRKRGDETLDEWCRDAGQFEAGAALRDKRERS